jgi:hypothetical protein
MVQGGPAGAGPPGPVGSTGADQERSDEMTYVVVMFGDQRGLEGEP